MYLSVILYILICYRSIRAGYIYIDRARKRLILTMAGVSFIFVSSLFESDSERRLLSCVAFFLALLLLFFCSLLKRGVVYIVALGDCDALLLYVRFIVRGLHDERFLGLD